MEAQDRKAIAPYLTRSQQSAAVAVDHSLELSEATEDREEEQEDSHSMPVEQDHKEIMVERQTTTTSEEAVVAQLRQVETRHTRAVMSQEMEAQEHQTQFRDRQSLMPEEVAVADRHKLRSRQEREVVVAEEMAARAVVEMVLPERRIPVVAEVQVSLMDQDHLPVAQEDRES